MRNSLLAAGVALAAATLVPAQVVVFEDFDFTGALTANGWVAHSGAGNRQIQSNGDYATLEQTSGSGEDVNLGFPSFTATETVYASFDLRLPSGNAVDPDGAGNYFVHARSGGASFRMRVGVLSPGAGGDFRVAINANGSNLGNGGIWPSDLVFDTWYKIVSSWNPATAQARLWVNPQNESSAHASHVGSATGNLIDSIALRQSNDYDGFQHIDNLVVGMSFCDVIPLEFDTNLGAPLGIGPGGDDAMTAVTLGFAFPFPNGTTTNLIDIDSNGRIVPQGADTSDFSESVLEFLGQTTSIAPYWDDLTPDGLGSGDIWFRTDASVAVITWQDVVRFNGPDEFSFQCQLYPDGRAVFCYDGRVPLTNDALVGVSEGNGASDPGASDVRALNNSLGVTTVYERFLSGEFDLADGCVAFTPEFPGWCVSGSYGLQPIPGFADHVAKPADVTLRFDPDGVGGYIVNKAVAGWVDDAGLSPVELATGLGDDALTTAQSLGHAFQGPGGAAWTSVRIDDNGVIHDGAGIEVSGDPTPSPLELILDDAKIAVFWTDLASQLGSLRFATTPTFSVITWEGVPQFGESNSFTFQARLGDDNSILLNYRETSQWTTGFGAAGDDVMIGVSGGGTPVDPGESDFADYPFVTGGSSTVYEFWDASGFAAGDLGDLPSIQPRLIATSTPALGESIDIAIEGISTSAALPTLIVGFLPLNLPVDFIGVSGGTLVPANDVLAPLTPVQGGDTFSLQLPLIPGLAVLLDAYFQAAYFAPENAFGLMLTDGLNVYF